MWFSLNNRDINFTELINAIVCDEIKKVTGFKQCYCVVCGNF